MRLSRSYFISLAFSSIAFASSDTESTCKALAAALPENLYYPDSPSYNATVTSYPFVQLRLEPNCVVRPKSALDVSTAVNVLRDSGCTKFAVKGGGHNANKGFNNIEDGVTIDMQSMNNTEYIQSTEVVQVGAGALAQNVYDTIEPFNKSALAPRIGVVGVGGFLSGGKSQRQLFALNLLIIRHFRRHSFLLSRERLCVRSHRQLRSRPGKRRHRERKRDLTLQSIPST